jgi:hypothetical protein
MLVFVTLLVFGTVDFVVAVVFAIVIAAVIVFVVFVIFVVFFVYIYIMHIDVSVFVKVVKVVVGRLLHPAPEAACHGE